MKRLFVLLPLVGLMWTALFCHLFYKKGGSTYSVVYVCAVVFFILFFTRWMVAYIRHVDAPKLDRDESFFYANWVTDSSGWIGGALYLTSKRIVFCPSRGNFHKFNFSLPLSETTEARVFLHTMRFQRSCRLAITNQAGKETIFVISQPKVWSEKLALARSEVKT